MKKKIRLHFDNVDMLNLKLSFKKQSKLKTNQETDDNNF